MNRETLDRWCERGVLFLVLAILVFGPLAMGAVDAWTFLIIQALAIGVILVWGVRLWISPHPRVLWPPISWVVLAFAVYAIGRYLTADIEYVARQEMIQVLLYAFLFFAIVNNLYQPESAQTISFILIFLATGISGYAVYQFLTHTNHVWSFISPYAGRGSGTYISPNDFAGFLEMLLPLAIAYALVGRVKPLVRALLIYAAVGVMAGLAVTFSRGGWVAATVGLLTLLLVLSCHRNHRLPALGLLIVFVAGGTVFATKFLTTTSGYAQRINDPGAFTQLDWRVRQDMWGAAFQMWRDHFWWGVGPAHYDYRFREYRPESMQMRPGRAHNDYLNLLADWGTVGGVMVLAGMAAFGAGLLKTRKYVLPPENDFGRGLGSRFAFFLGASTGLLALAVHSLVDFNLHVPANAILGVTLLALLSSNLRFATERYWLTARLPLKTLTTLVLIAGGAYL
ncbi:MAG: O-antigen ligase family protein, partial [Verrucomicrobiia bacterium]